MRKWLKHCGLELRLLLRNPFLIALPVLFSLIYFIFVLDMMTYDYSSMYTNLYNFTAAAHTITLGPAMLLGILTIRRDIRKSSFDWNRSIPVSFHMLLSAKYAIAQLYMLLYTLAAAGIAYFVLVSHGFREGYVFRHVLSLAFQFEVSYLVTVALAMLLAVSIPNRVVYLIGFCGWMFGTFFMDMFMIDQAGWHILRTFHLNQFFLNDNLASYESWGRELIWPERQLSWRFVLSFTFLLLAVSLLLLNRLRPTMFLRRCGMLTLGAAILAVATFMPYAALYEEQSDRQLGLLSDPTVRTLKNVRPPLDAKLAISDYDIVLVRDEENILRFTVNLKVPSESREGRSSFPLTLNRNFKVDSVRTGGSDAVFRHQGDRLSVEIPPAVSGNLDIEVQYSGKVMEFLNYYNTLQYTMFSVGEEVNLPKTMAWYPLPGYQDIYVKEEMPSRFVVTYPYQLYFPPAAFRLTVKGYTLPLYAGIPVVERTPDYQRFEGRETTGVSLLGSRDWLEKKLVGKPVRVVMTPFNEKYVTRQMIDLEKKYDYFEKWVPGLGERYIEILHWQGSGWSRYKSVSNGQITTDGSYYNGITNSLPGEWMNIILFGDQKGYELDEPSGTVESDVRAHISSLFWYVYYRQEEGLTDKEQADYYNWTRSVRLLLFKDKNLDPKGIGRKMSAQVSHALKRGQEREVREVLLYFYRKGLNLPSREENLYIKEKPIPYSEWQQKWEEIVGTPSKRVK